METFISVGIIAAIVFTFAPLVYECRRWLTKAQRIHMYIIIPVLALLVLTSCGSNPDDHTGENWLLLIGFLLVWLKG